MSESIRYQQFNEENGIVPTTIRKEIREPIRSKETQEMAVKYMSKKIKKQSKVEIEKLLVRLDKEMREVVLKLIHFYFSHCLFVTAAFDLYGVNL
ncbi:MAG: hypothetical protein ACOX1F_02350 [Erysipelotrichaceae bacterium]